MEINKKVLILAGIFPPDIGGPAVYAQRLAQEFSRRRIWVKVICYSARQEDGAADSKMPFEVVRVPKNLGPFRFLVYLWQTLRLARGSDILYVQTLFSAGIPGLLAAKLFGKKLAMRITGDHSWERFNKGETLNEFQNRKYGWRAEFVKKAQASLLKKVSGIVVPSQYLKKIVAGWGIASGRIEVIYNAPSCPSGSNVAAEEVREEIGAAGDIILSVGRLMPWKGFDALIEIMPDLLKDNPGLCLVIAGDGPQAESLQAKIKSLALENNVRLIGRLEHSRIGCYLQAASLFVLNSGYEGLSHVILEAMQAGLPVITTDVGGNPELIEDGKNGILVGYNNKEQLKQALLKLLKDKTLREKFGQNSRERLKEFSWQNIMDKTLEFFSGL